MERMSTWMQQYLETLKCEAGQTFAEYAIIFAAVVIVAMVGFQALGPAILNIVNQVATAI